MMYFEMGKEGEEVDDQRLVIVYRLGVRKVVCQNKGEGE